MPDETAADLTNIDVLKGQVSINTGIPADVLRGDNLEEIQAHAEALQDLLPEQPRTPGPGYVAGEGRTVGKAAPVPSQDFAAWLNHQLGGYTR
jgi:hypothetical protein